MFARNSGREFPVVDLQLYLNLPCVVMKNDEEGLIILLKKATESIFCRFFFLNLTLYDFNGLDSK